MLILAAASPASAQWHPSARIYSLGGDDVSGVIPDYITDLALNPAHASFADRFTANYGLRQSALSLPPYPLATYSEMQWRPFSSNAIRTNEVSLWGIQAGTWRISAAAEWAFYDSQENGSEFQFSEWDTYIRSRNTLDCDQTDFFRGGIAAGRSTSNDYAIGMRLDGFVCRTTSTYQEISIYDYFREEDLLTLDSEDYHSYMRDGSFLETRFRIQGGLIANAESDAATEITAGAAFSRTSTDVRRYDQNTSERYEDGEINYYEYTLEEWRDIREGDRWIFDASFRRRLPADLRLYSGAEYSTIRYDTDWMSAARLSRWNPSSSRGSSDCSAFADEGRSQSVAWYGKLGKKISIREDLGLYAGVHAAYRRTWADEQPVIRYTFMAWTPTDSLTFDQPVSLESLRQEGRLALPISIEFAPRGYCTFFCGLTSYLYATDTWYDLPAPRLIEYYMPTSRAAGARMARGAAQAPSLDGFPATITDTDRVLTASYTATLGLSLHLRDRFSFDLYTANAPVPSSINNTFLDVRYRF